MYPLYFIGPDNRSRPEPDQHAGSLDFSGNEISLLKTADGAILRLPYVIHLNAGVHVSVSGIAAEIALQPTQPPLLALGIAFDPCCYVKDTDYKFPVGWHDFSIQGQLRLPLTLAALEAVERLRSGARLEFTVTLSASAFVRNKETGLYEACRVDVPPGQIQLRVDQGIWQSRIRTVSPFGSVLVEIPLAMTRAAPWDRVWARLDAASANLAQGGQSGCKNCVSEVRQALDAWRSIDEFKEPPNKSLSTRPRINP